MSISAPPVGSAPTPEPTKPNATPADLHSIAVDIQTDLQTLATGLAHQGAAPPAVATLTHMAGVIGQVVKILGEGGAPPPEASPQMPQHQAPPSPGAAGPGAASAAPGGGAAPPIKNPHAALGAAVDMLHRGMVASAQPGR